MGMGPFEDPALFLESGRDTLALAQRMMGLESTHRLLDLGCGCGRLGVHMPSFLSPTGTYTGLDIDSACIAWCVENIEMHDPRFSFVTVDVQSHAYNPAGGLHVESITFPFDDNAFDRAIVSSVFTHMTEAGIARYMTELHRVTANDGLILVSLFLMDDAARSAAIGKATSFTFDAQLDENSWSIDAATPLDGVAVDPAWFQKTARARGLEVKRIEYGTWRTRRGWKVDHDWVVIGQ